jgi:putative transcriptional regulator
MTGDAYLTDQLLIAMPAMQDGNFARTVAYVCRHTADGAMALVLNRPVGLSVADILEQLKLDASAPALAAMPVLSGGPVQTERGFVLHADDGRPWESSLAVRPGLCLTTSRDILVALAEGRAPAPLMFALGYAGWGAGQLDRELLENAWLTVPADPAILFETPVERRWQAAADLVGVDLSRMSGYAGRA